MKKVKLNLSGLACDGCVKSVEEALQKAGAEDVKVTMNNAEFNIDNAEDSNKYVKTVNNLGYTAELAKE